MEAITLVWSFVLLSVLGGSKPCWAAYCTYTTYSDFEILDFLIVAEGTSNSLYDCAQECCDLNTCATFEWWENTGLCLLYNQNVNDMVEDNLAYSSGTYIGILNYKNGYTYIPDNQGISFLDEYGYLDNTIPSPIPSPAFNPDTIPGAPVQESTSGGGSSTNIGLIVGAVVGGLVAVALIAGLVVFFVLRSKKKAKEANNPEKNIGVVQMPVGYSHIDAPSLQARPTGNFDPYKTLTDKKKEKENSIIIPGVATIAYGDIQMSNVIGEGSFGKVYRGIYFGQNVAVKILLDNSPGNQAAPAKSTKKAPSSEIAKELKHEVSLLSKLSHPNVLRFIGFCSDPPCIVTEICDKGSLADIIGQARTWPPDSLTWKTRLRLVRLKSIMIIVCHRIQARILPKSISFAQCTEHVSLTNNSFNYYCRLWMLRKGYYTYTRTTLLIAILKVPTYW